MFTQREAPTLRAVTSQAQPYRVFKVKPLFAILPLAIAAIAVNGCAKKGAPVAAVKQRPGYIRIINMSDTSVGIFAGGRSLLISLGAGKYSQFTTVPAVVENIQIVTPVDYAHMKPGSKPNLNVLASCELSNSAKTVESVIYDGKSGYVVKNDLMTPGDTNVKLIMLSDGQVKPITKAIKIGPVTAKPGQDSIMVTPGSYSVGNNSVDIKSHTTYLVITDSSGKVLKVCDYAPRKPVAAGTAAG